VVDWWTLGYLVFLGLADPAAYLVIINTSTGFTSVLVMVFMSLTTMPFIVVLYGLTCDGGQSLLSRALRHSAAKWLGTVSYSLYLSHALIVGYFKLALFAASSAPPGCHDDSEDCVTQWNEWHASRQYPAWYALPMIAAALPLAYLVYVWVEEPARKLLVQAPDDITKCLSVEVQVATAPFTISSDCSGWGSFSSAIDDPPKPATSREPEDSQAQLLPDQTQS
jgi:peptidoglycan/LPS O-acetylase OafA/YrhL